MNNIIDKSITSSGHRLSPPSCDHCWWLKGLEVIRKIWEVNLGFHGRFLPVYHLFRSSSVPFHLHSVPSFFRPVVPEEVRNRATDVRNERGREGPNDEGTKGTGERDGSEGDTVTRALANHPSLVSLLSPSVPFGSFHSPAARMMSGASNVSDVRRRGRDRREPDEPRQEKDERNRRKPHERWEAYGSFLIIGWAGGGCNRSLTCFRRVIVTHFLSPSFPHVLHSSLHCVSRLVTLRSEDGNVSDGRWAWVTRERHGERDVGSGRDGRLIRALGRQ